MDATCCPIARHREATVRTDEIEGRDRGRVGLCIPSCPSSSPFPSSIVGSPCLSLTLNNVFLSPHSRPRLPSASPPSSSPFPSFVAVSPCLSLSLNNIFSASPLLSSPFPNSVIISPSSLVATFSTPTAVSISLVIFSILSPQHLRSPHSRPRPRQLFPLRLWCCLELTSSPAMTKLFTDRTLS
ncbi:hypothetical protein ACLOJK_019337 [Asimina triloba]